ncbi:MAG: ABC transporter ATP-binding protein [Cypionkella sp.]
MKPLLWVENLSKDFVAEHSLFGRTLKTVRAVDDVSLHIERGETLALVGESGCGKSTLGRLIMRLIEPTSGAVMLGDDTITGLSEKRLMPLRRRVQLVFQDPFASLNPRMTVGQTIGEPLMLHNIVPEAARADRVRELLTSVGLSPQHMDRYPHEFSGGQRQRIVIARALASEPELIICDEPVSALDVSIRSQVLNLLADLQREFGFSYLFISHDLSVVRHIADRVAVMYLGRIVEIGDTEAVFRTPRHPYTRALIASIPQPSPANRETMQPLEGDMPSPLNPPSGCHFHTRCPFVQDLCRRERPALISSQEHQPAACHFQDVIPPADDLARAVPVDPRLERLFAAFRAPGVPETTL